MSTLHSQSRRRRGALGIILGVSLLGAFPGVAAAVPDSGAVISNGTVMLGVLPTGNLNYNCSGGEPDDRAARGGADCPANSASGNTSVVGVRYVPNNTDGTADGCACEGWGVADANSGLTGFGNASLGYGNLTPVSFDVTPTTAVSVVDVSDAAIPGYAMRVKQDYHPATQTENLFEDTTTITNTGTEPITDLRFRRNMDWDIEPTQYREWVSVANTAASSQLLYDSDNGFVSSDPLSARSALQSESVCGAGYTGTCEFTNLGSSRSGSAEYPTTTSPGDHGAMFDFGFGALAPGKTRTFRTYYGAAANGDSAEQAVADEDLGVYSLGKPDCGNNGRITGLCADVPAFGGVELGQPNTFVFGFVTNDADLSIASQASSDATVGSPSTTRFTVHNDGPDKALGTVARITLPEGVTFDSATTDQGTCTFEAPDVVCELDGIPDGGDVHIDLTVTPTGTGTTALHASVTSRSNDAAGANDESTSQVTAASVATAPPAATPGATASPVPSATAPPASSTTLPTCVSTRKVTIHWNAPKRAKAFRRQLVMLNGRLARTMGGKGRSATIDFSGKGRSIQKIRVVATATNGTRYAITRTFRICTNTKNVSRPETVTLHRI